MLTSLIVLWSSRDEAWKIADFGTACEATSKRLLTTRLSRGISGYRAPEVLEDDAKFNNKADIWALGCICYEVLVGIKPFTSDWHVGQMAAAKKLKLQYIISRPWRSHGHSGIMWIF